MPPLRPQVLVSVCTFLSFLHINTPSPTTAFLQASKEELGRNHFLASYRFLMSSFPVLASSPISPAEIQNLNLCDVITFSPKVWPVNKTQQILHSG